MDIDENLPGRRDDPLAILIKQDIDALSVVELAHLKTHALDAP